MDCPDSPDEPLTPQRSPSRLDFCVEDLEACDDSPMHRSDWPCPSFGDEYPYTFIGEQDLFALNVALPRLITEDDPIDGPPRTTDSCSHENTDPPSLFFAPDDPEEDIVQIVIEPHTPIPVRPPSVQIPADAHESMPPANTTPNRLNYPHRGFSHSALLQQKALWYSRHEEWAEWQSRVDQSEAQRQQSDAYSGIATHRHAVSPPPYMRTPPSGLERDRPPKPQARRPQGVHTSIYPRVGDISALRDPYPVNIDRSLFMFPLWTLNKALYAFDMHWRSAPFATSVPAYNLTPIQVSGSTSTLSSYSSSTFGDDEESDSTLVEDDSPVPKSQLPLELLQSTSSPHTPPPWDSFLGWELSWYTRWEVLLGIFQRDYPGPRYNMFGYPVRLPPPPTPIAHTSPPDRIFHFTIGEDGDDNGDDEDDNYRRSVADSSFDADFDEECERALAFYNRELRRSEVTP